jgi:hypothetical protein
MSDLVPSTNRYDRKQLERVIQRAAELQSRERDVGDSLTEEELLQLGQEVGIAPTHLRRALQEERSRALVPAEGGTMVRLFGPKRVATERVINGKPEKVEQTLFEWMSEGELLQVKRRFPDSISWERKEGAWASLRRSLGVGGRKYLLARSREIVTRVSAIDEDRSLIQLIADLSNTRNEYLTGSTLLLSSGGAITGIAFVLGVMAPVALVPAIVSLPIAYTVARDRRRQVDKVLVALEQILDRLEHGDLDQKPKLRGPHLSVVDRITDEIRKNLRIDG